MKSKKKIFMLLMLLVLSFSTFSLGGCGLFNKEDTSEESEEKEDKEDKEKEDEEDGSDEDKEDEGKDKEDEDEDEPDEEGDSESEEKEEEDDDWTPNVDLNGGGSGEEKEDGTQESPEGETGECNCVGLCDAYSISQTCEECKKDYKQCKGMSSSLDDLALPEGQTATARIAVFGSNFFNDAIINGTDKSYKYEYIYDNLKNTLSNYDIKVISQETTLTSDNKKHSGKYPCKAPATVADTLSKVGFNVISSASDHSFDNGVSGINETVTIWNQYPNMLLTGIYSNKEDYDNISMMDVNGIRVSFLSYTASLNGVTLTNDEKPYVKTLFDEDFIAKEIKYASENSDFVVVLPHWTSGDLKKHSANQEKWAKVFVKNGADLIIGSGSNTIQDVALYQDAEGNSVPCYYSLGNLVGSVDNPSQALSGMAEISITKTGKVTVIDSYNMLPIIQHVSKKGDYFQPYMLEEYTEEKLKYHNLVVNKKGLTIDGAKAMFNETVKIEELNNTSQSEPTVAPVQPPQGNLSNNPAQDSNGNTPNNSLGNLQVIGG